MPTDLLSFRSILEKNNGASETMIVAILCIPTHLSSLVQTTNYRLCFKFQNPVHRFAIDLFAYVLARGSYIDENFIVMGIHKQQLCGDIVLQ